MRGLPEALVRAEPAVVRPRDLRGTWADPHKELRALAEQGLVLHLAHGYYAVVPERARGTRWTPAVEAVGLAIGQADYGVDGSSLMGPSAARVLGVIPRALGVATVAVVKQRPPLDTTAGRIRFVTRAVTDLDRQRVDTELARGWTTTPEQTLVDLADRPGLGGLAPADIAEALGALATRADTALALQLTTEQHKRRARDRLRAALEGGSWHDLLTADT